MSIEQIANTYLIDYRRYKIDHSLKIHIKAYETHLEHFYEIVHHIIENEFINTIFVLTPDLQLAFVVKVVKSHFNNIQPKLFKKFVCSKKSAHT